MCGGQVVEDSIGWIETGQAVISAVATWAIAHPCVVIAAVLAVSIFGAAHGAKGRGDPDT